MTTKQTPEQRARLAYAAASWAHHLAEARGRLGAKNDAECTELAKVAEAKGDMYGRERYLAGKVEALKRLDSPPAHSRTLTTQIQRAEAEYAACVAALQEVAK